MHRLAKDRIADAGAEVNKGQARDGGSLLKGGDGLAAGVGIRAASRVGAAAIDVLHDDRHFYFEHIYPKAGLGEIAHGSHDFVRLDLRIGNALFIGDVVGIGVGLQEEDDIGGFAFCADAFDQSVFGIVDLGAVIGVVIHHDLDALSALIHQPLY